MREVTVTSKEELFILLLCYNDLSDYLSKSSLYYIIVLLKISLCLWQLSQVHLPLYSRNYCAIFHYLTLKKNMLLNRTVANKWLQQNVFFSQTEPRNGLWRIGSWERERILFTDIVAKWKQILYRGPDLNYMGFYFFLDMRLLRQSAVHV